MKNNRKKSIRMRVLLSSIIVCILESLSGCSGVEDITRDNLLKAAVNENRAVRDNTIILAGSTSMEKLANILAEGFMEKYPEITVTVEFTGSSAGVEAVLSGRADIGNSSRELKEEEKLSGAVGNIVAIDGIAVITDASNMVGTLTTKQLAEIYTGRIRNWSEVGGTDTAIVVTGREAGSGTRNTFEKLLGIRDRCRYANELDSVGAVLARVASTQGAIGYVSFDVLDDTVRALAVNDIEAAEENVKTNRYVLCQPLLMVTKGEISEQSEAVQWFFAYLQSEEGREMIRMAGVIVPERAVNIDLKGYG